VTELRNVFWIGGGTAAGKSSVAIALAERHGLERYSYDWHDARDHSDRTRADRHPVRAAFLAMSVDEQWVHRTPQQMAVEALTEFAERFEMVLEDLAALRAERVIADGFGLLPELIAPVTVDRSHAIFLLPTPAFRDWALAMRGWIAREGTSNPVRARANRLARDALLTIHVREQAKALGFATIEVDGTRSLTEIMAEVEARFSPFLVWS
jgi:hypothetical protein